MVLLLNDDPMPLYNRKEEWGSYRLAITRCHSWWMSRPRLITSLPWSRPSSSLESGFCTCRGPSAFGLDSGGKSCETTI